ncbi:hypothetical protein BH11BAC2_BH11BAC2_22460 [soil metagenome]
MTSLFFHTGSSSFADKDELILKKLGKVYVFSFTSTFKWLTPLIFLKQFIFIMKHLFKTNCYVSQFAGYHSFLPGIFSKLTGKPFIIISGGTDCVSFPSIRYGNFYKTVLGLFTKWSFQLSTHLAPKHHSLWSCDYSYEKSDPNQQGIAAFVPQLNKPVTPIANGYDVNFWKSNVPKKEKSFLTVSGGFQYPFQVQLKGIDLILSVAPLFPDCTFTIVGVPDWKKLAIKSSNIIILPPTKNSELLPLYSEAQFYMQLSMAEGFPNALCEAMLCNSIPIVSDVFSMPEIVGESGFILKERDMDQLTQLIHQALAKCSNELGKKAREQITSSYTIERRELALTALLEKVILKV